MLFPMYVCVGLSNGGATQVLMLYPMYVCVGLRAHVIPYECVCGSL